MQKHKKRKTCKKSNKIKNNNFAPAISTKKKLSKNANAKRYKKV